MFEKNNTASTKTNNRRKDSCTDRWIKLEFFYKNTNRNTTRSTREVARGKKSTIDRQNLKSWLTRGISGHSFGVNISVESCTIESRDENEKKKKHNILFRRLRKHNSRGLRYESGKWFYHMERTKNTVLTVATSGSTLGARTKNTGTKGRG